MVMQVVHLEEGLAASSMTKLHIDSESDVKQEWIDERDDPTHFTW